MLCQLGLSWAPLGSPAADGAACQEPQVEVRQGGAGQAHQGRGWQKDRGLGAWDHNSPFSGTPNTSRTASLFMWLPPLYSFCPFVHLHSWLHLPVTWPWVLQCEQHSGEGYPVLCLLSLLQTPSPAQLRGVPPCPSWDCDHISHFHNSIMLSTLQSAGALSNFQEVRGTGIRKLHFNWVPIFITLHFTPVNFISPCLPQPSGSWASGLFSLCLHIDIASKFCHQQILSGIFCAQEINENIGVKTAS